MAKRKNHSFFHHPWIQYHVDTVDIPEKLIHIFGIRMAYYIHNLVREYGNQRYNQQLEEDSSFIYPMAEQSRDLQLSQHIIRSYKKDAVKRNIIKTHMMGIPPKEYYCINIEILYNFIKGEF